MFAICLADSDLEVHFLDVSGQYIIVSAATQDKREKVILDRWSDHQCLVERDPSAGRC